MERRAHRAPDIREAVERFKEETPVYLVEKLNYIEAIQDHGVITYHVIFDDVFADEVRELVRLYNRDANTSNIELDADVLRRRLSEEGVAAIYEQDPNFYDQILGLWNYVDDRWEAYQAHKQDQGGQGSDQVS